MGKRRPIILIADDEKQFRDRFAAQHADSGYAIEQASDVLCLPQLLQDADRLPDLVVLDLYRTKSTGTSQAALDDAIVNGLISDVEAATRPLKAEVDRLKEPSAIRVLHEIRTIPRLKNLPVLIYTRQGLALLSDDDLKHAARDGAEWMLKGRSAAVERAQMDEFLRRARLERPRLQRDIVLMVAGAVLGVVLSIIAKQLT